MLEALMRASPATLSTEDLLEQVWDEHADPFTKTVSVTIARLRRKLGDPDVIQTIPGVRLPHQLTRRRHDLRHSAAWNGELYSSTPQGHEPWRRTAKRRMARRLISAKTPSTKWRASWICWKRITPRNCGSENIRCLAWRR